MNDEQLKSVQMVRGEGVTRLPDEIATSVGHIAHQFALLEGILKDCIYELVGVSGTVGRIAIGTARAEDQVSKIEDLMTHLGYAFDPPLSDFKKQVAKAEQLRDSIIHGHWAKDPETGELLLLELTGKWDIGAKSPRVTKRMYPAGRPKKNEDLIEIRANITAAAKSAWIMHKRLQTLLDKSPSPRAPDRPIGDQSESKPPDPPTPSQG